MSFAIFALRVGSITFATPSALILVLSVPAIVYAYLWVLKRRAAAAVKFTNLNLLSTVVGKDENLKRHLPAVLFVLALLTLCLGVGQPRAKLNSEREEATVVLVIDVSGSMEADDVLPTRLQAAQDAANTFLDRIPEKFRVGVISFSTAPSVLQQPTADRDDARKAIASMKADGGTAMGDALERALDLKRTPAPTAKPGVATPKATPNQSESPTTVVPSNTANDTPFVVLLLSDGKNTIGNTDPLDAADDAAKMKVPVFTIALGTENGQIANPDPSTQGFPLYIPVPPDPATLKEIAKVTGGQFFDAPSASKLEEVYKSLGSKVGTVRKESDLSHWFAGGAALLFLAAAGLSLTWQQRLP